MNLLQGYKKNPEITPPTVYRIADTFHKAGLVSKMSHPGGKCFYDATQADHYHILKDNEIIDYIDPELTTLIKNHLKVKSFKHLDFIEKISIQIIVSNWL